MPLLRALPVREIGETCHKARALLRCAAVAVALERYRLANGRWPDDLAALVPKYLAAVPADPFDGKPLRYARIKRGRRVFGRPRRQARDRSTIPRLAREELDSEVSFRLSNVEARHKAK